MEGFLNLYREKKFGSVKPLRTFDVAELGTAMRYFSEGKHIGKIVIVYDNPDAIVKVSIHSPVLPLVLATY